MRIQAYGYLRGHDEALVMEHDPAQRRLLVAYRTGDRLAGALAVGLPSKTVRALRALVAAGTAWESAASDAAAA
jgi:hypothetical protein